VRHLDPSAAPVQATSRPARTPWLSTSMAMPMRSSPIRLASRGSRCAQCGAPYRPEPADSKSRSNAWRQRAYGDRPAVTWA